MINQRNDHTKPDRMKLWQVPVTIRLDECLVKAIDNAHVSKAEYIREAVRRKLEQDGFLPLKGLLYRGI